MKDFTSCIAVVLLRFFVAVAADREMNTKNISVCVQAQPNVNLSVVQELCRPYKYPKSGVCKKFIGNNKVYGSDKNQTEKEESYARIVRGKRIIERFQKVKVRESCWRVAFQELCQGAFAKCDLTSGKLMPRPVCRETCEEGIKTCEKEYKMLEDFNKIPTSRENRYPLFWDLPKCDILPFRNGGDIPECYFSRRLNTETDKLKGTGCYYGNGLGYRGNVSVTRSGHVCQSWSSQCPHRHDHPLSEYPELVNASNWCRNPGGQGPDGPWCYTTNSSRRWEYCDVRKCPPPAPTRPPVVSQAYATGSSKIYIKWEPVPLPFFHGHPGGYRIKISELGQEPMVNTTSPNVTDFEYRSLQPLGNYSLSVLAFNDAGDGPSSHQVYVKTLPKRYVAVRYSLTLKKTEEYRNSSSEIKAMILNSFKKKPPNGYNFFEINIARLMNSSNEMEFDVTAELTGRPSWSAVQDITGRILRTLKNNNKIAQKFWSNSFHVKAPPPPPAKVSTSDVEMTSVTVDWSAPLYHEPYRITNHTVQYKKAGTDMKYYDAVTVGSHKTKVTVKNLVSGQKYLIRVKSANDYGSEASEPMDVEMQATSTTKKVLSIVLPLFFFVLITGIALGRWWFKKRKENREIQKMIRKLRENPYESVVDWFAVLKIKITKQWWEIPRDDLLLDENLGSGAFGVVMKGYLTKREEGENENRILVAIKMLKDNPTEQELRDLCNEINVMSSVGDHPNVVSLIGACTINGPPWLVVNFAPNGCLLDHLKDHRPPPEYQNIRDVTKSQLMLKPISEKERMRFAYEIAQGMAHLERHRFVHRDLSARNILLGKSMAAMVSDFGLSRDIYESGAYENTTGGVLPVRWMALESLQDYTYTSMSDVWSYGVLLWEIETGGLVPYAGMSGAEVVERLRQGYRLERPDNTPRDIYGIMWHCWNPDPNQRPTFADLVYKIGGLLQMSGEYEEIETISMADNNEDGTKTKPQNTTIQTGTDPGQKDFSEDDNLKIEDTKL